MEIIEKPESMLLKKVSYHSDVEIDTHPINSFCMLMVVLLRSRSTILLIFASPYYLVDVRWVNFSACVPS